jgi:DNA polymerase III alpha subunit
MNTNEYGQVMFTANEILDMIYSEQNIDECDFPTSETQKYNQFANFFNVSTKNVAHHIDESADIFHKRKSSTWTMPLQYQNMDIEKFLSELLVSKHLTSSEYTNRLVDELEQFKKRNMLNVLKFLCYLMQTCKTHDIVTGVGRGSSVSSLVLHLLDVHQIDPVKYNLDYKEFLR